MILCNFVFNQDLSHFSVYLRFTCKWSVKWKAFFGGESSGWSRRRCNEGAAEGAISSGSQSYGTNRSRLGFPNRGTMSIENSICRARRGSLNHCERIVSQRGNRGPLSNSFLTSFVPSLLARKEKALGTDKSAFEIPIRSCSRNELWRALLHDVPPRDREKRS